MQDIENSIKEIKTLDDFLKIFSDKEAEYFEKNFKKNCFKDLQDNYFLFLGDKFRKLTDEEKLNFTVDEANKIKCARFIASRFHYITIAERRKNKLNADEKLKDLVKSLIDKYFYAKSQNASYLCFSYFTCDNLEESFYNEFILKEFSVWDIDFLIKYSDLLPFDLNKLLSTYFSNKKSETENFVEFIKKSPHICFDILAGKVNLIGDNENNNLLIYLYINMEKCEQIAKRFSKLSDTTKNNLVRDKKIIITQEHINLLPDGYIKEFAEKRISKSIIKPKNQLEIEIKKSQVQIEEKTENRNSIKICEGIKLFFAGLVSSGSIASIIVGAIAIASLLTLSFSPWILVGVGTPVLIVGGIFFGKSVKNLRSLSSMANESNVKEENDGSSAISKENNKDENNISRPEVQEKEEDKSEIDLNN